jgi:hypothetical protein
MVAVIEMPDPQIAALQAGSANLAKPCTTAKFCPGTATGNSK